MELRHYLREVWSYKFAIIAAVALTAIVTFLLTNSSPKSYTAEARLVVIAGLGSDGSDTDDVLNAPRVGQTYAVLATTRPALQEVIDRADLPYEPDELLPRITVTASLDTPFMTITMDDGDPEQAAAAANAMAEVLVELATVDGGPEVGDLPLLRVVEAATPPTIASAPRVLFSTALSAAAAMASCLLILAFVVYVRADAPRSPGAQPG